MKIALNAWWLKSQGKQNTDQNSFLGNRIPHAINNFILYSCTYIGSGIFVSFWYYKPYSCYTLLPIGRCYQHLPSTFHSLRFQNRFIYSLSFSFCFPSLVFSFMLSDGGVFLGIFWGTSKLNRMSKIHNTLLNKTPQHCTTTVCTV